MSTQELGKKVLLVDDEVDICDFLADYLKDNEIQSFAANDITSALEIAMRHKIDLIFLDNNLLNNVKGIDYIPQFKSINPNCKVYMLTANTQPEVKEKSQIRGSDGFIQKPFDFDTFDMVINSLKE